VRVLAVYTSPELFGVFKRQPQLGRNLVPSDDEKSAAPVTVMSYAAWQRYFAGDRSVVGRDITVDGQAFTVVGVTPEDLFLPSVAPALYVPLHLNPDVIKFGEHRGHRHLQVIGRISEASSIESARSELEAAYADIEKEHADEPLRPQVTGLKEHLV